MLEELNEDATSENTAASALLDLVVAAHGRGERRPQQATMVEEVAQCLTNRSNLLIQAGTGVGKSLGYLIPVVASGQRVVVSTATKQLSEQISNIDIPFLEKVTTESGHGEFSHANLKGRANYACLRKIDELEKMDAEIGGGSSSDSALPLVIKEEQEAQSRAEKRGAEVAAVIEWAKGKDGGDGDRSNAPVVSDETWRSVSSTNSECPGRLNCPFGSECFAELARGKAAAADVVVTNHALVATELKDPESTWRVLGERSSVIFDEMHELDGSLSDAWGCSVTGRRLEEDARVLRRAVPANENDVREYISELSEYGERLTEVLAERDEELVREWDTEIATILKGASLASVSIVRYFIAQEKNQKEDTRAILAGNTVEELVTDLASLLGGDSDDGETVRWIGNENGTPALCSGPLRVGPKLMESLEAAGSTMIGTSATISVGRSFDIPTRNLALEDSNVPHKSLDVGTPFDYPKQGIMFVPPADSFPAPVGKERFEHTEAVLDMLVKIVKAAGGRTLALSTTTAGARRMAERLRDEVDTPVLSQFDAPPGVIAEEFANVENSSLCATMGMWHGLNVPGPSLSAVVIDKIPFAPMNNPLLKARVEDVNARGGSGFMDVYVAQASVMLAQGVGRLIRHTTDRGVVAILDTRLLTKGYGRTMLKSLPPMWRAPKEQDMLDALARVVSD